MDVVTYALANSQAKKQIDDALEPFIITLTPTNEDFSGTHDRTVAEISAAVNSGVKIFFRFGFALYPINEIIANTSSITVGGTFLTFDNILTHSWYLIRIQTDPDFQTYSTVLFPITPAS